MADVATVNRLIDTSLRAMAENFRARFSDNPSFDERSGLMHEGLALKKAGLFLCLSLCIHAGLLLLPVAFPTQSPLKHNQIELVESTLGSSASSVSSAEQTVGKPALAGAGSAPVARFNAPDLSLPIEGSLRQAAAPKTLSNAAPIAAALTASEVADPEGFFVPDQAGQLPVASDPAYAAPEAPSASVPGPVAPSYAPEQASEIAAAPQTIEIAPTKKTAAAPVVAPVITKARLLSPKGLSPSYYPLLARQKGIEGAVKLAVEVLASGAVGAIKITRSSGRQDLDQAAIATVKAQKGEPKTVGEEKVSSWLACEVQFKLKD